MGPIVSSHFAAQFDFILGEVPVIVYFADI